MSEQGFTRYVEQLTITITMIAYIISKLQTFLNACETAIEISQIVLNILKEVVLAAGRILVQQFEASLA